MAEGFAVRRAEEADVPACAAVINAWIDETGWFPRLYAPEDIEAMIRKALPRREIWVGGRPAAGYLSLNPDTGHVAALYCSVRGAGLGKALMDRAKEGRSHLWLTTHQRNGAAQRFYRREGFVDAGPVAPVPPETVPELKMEWWR